jgi:glutathione S-transferase
MKLWTFPPAPNPRKLAVYLAEKGLDIPVELINLVEGRQNSPEFLAINPKGAVPVLELDDGSRLTESLAIIEYLEELNPDPPMIGTDPLERARVREAERMIDLGVLIGTARIVHARRLPLPGREANPEVVRAELERRPVVLDSVNTLIGEKPFVMGARPTIADCTLFGALSFGEIFEVTVDPVFGNITRWYEDFKQRPSAELIM